jgi:hypothetical protein
LRVEAAKAKPAQRAAKQRTKDEYYKAPVEAEARRKESPPPPTPFPLPPCNEGLLAPGGVKIV